jgi:hypothetical protein
MFLFLGDWDMAGFFVALKTPYNKAYFRIIKRKYKNT